MGVRNDSEAELGIRSRGLRGLSCRSFNDG